MKISYLFKLFALLLVSSKTFGQNKIYFKKCIFEKVFTKCQMPPTFGSSNLDLQKYFTEKLKEESSNVTGQIKISLIIDREGKTCCEWIEDHSNLNWTKRKLNSMIDAMPTWNSGTQNGAKVDCVELVLLTFNENTLVVEYRMGRK